MALKPGDIANFQTLLKAAHNQDLTLLECTDTQSGEYRAVVCATYVDADEQFNFVPLAIIPPGNPYELLTFPEDQCKLIEVEAD